MAPTRLVVKLTRGLDSPEIVNQALNVAATAASLGAEVSLWLASDATALAQPGIAASIHLEQAIPAEDLLDILLQHSVTVCSQCAARRGVGSRDFYPQVRIAGVTTFVAEIMRPDTQVVTY